MSETVAPPPFPETAGPIRLRIKGTQRYINTRTGELEPGYDGASTARRVRNWMPTADGVNRLTLNGLQWQRNRSRDLVRKVPWITSGVESLVSNIVGEGIRPMSQSSDEKFRAAAQAIFADWMHEADAYGILDFFGMQSLAQRSEIEAGEVFIRFRRRLPEDGLTVPLQLQIIEAEHVPLALFRAASAGVNKIIAGIEFDALGRRVAYHMLPEHPGENLASGGGFNLKTVRVPADEVVHLFRQVRPGQVRGVPWLSPVILQTRDLLEYQDAERLRKKTAAMFAGFVTRPDPDSNPFESEESDHDDVPMVSLEPGTMQLLEPGEEVTFSSPADVGAGYEAFMATELRAIAAGLGTTYEKMTGDLRGVNFSSARVGLNEFERRATVNQRRLAFQLCARVYAAVITEAIIDGSLSMPTGFVKRPQPHLRAKWIAPGWRYINPAQEISAEKDSIRSGLASRDEVVSGHGRDAETVDNENAAAQERADRLNLAYDTDGRRMTAQGQAQQAPADEPTKTGA
ncbi:MAG: phage portal protein [Parvibaculum sp.]|nr:phage portal protein [Parvibaculum sp.]